MFLRRIHFSIRMTETKITDEQQQVSWLSGSLPLRLITLVESQSVLPYNLHRKFRVTFVHLRRFLLRRLLLFIGRARVAKEQDAVRYVRIPWRRASKEPVDTIRLCRLQWWTVFQWYAIIKNIQERFFDFYSDACWSEIQLEEVKRIILK